MLKIKLLIFSLCLFTLSISAQKSVNDFKYIIVPSQFEFQNNAGDFQLNEMTKFLFNKYGFIALLSTEVFPKGRLNNFPARTRSFRVSESNTNLTHLNRNKLPCYLLNAFRNGIH